MAPSKLYQWRQRDSEECYACGDDWDTIEHIFMNILCPYSLRVWRAILDDFNAHEGVLVHWTPEEVLFGFLNPTQEISPAVLTRLNTIMLVAKHYIYRQRRLESFLYSAVLFKFRRFLLLQWHVSQDSDNITPFENNWSSCW